MMSLFKPVRFRCENNRAAREINITDKSYYLNLFFRMESKMKSGTTDSANIAVSGLV